MAAAIRLGAMGFEVEVYEKNDRLGGRMGRLEENGFAFDTGPSLLLMTDTYRELFSFAGRDLDDYVRLIPLDGQYRVNFEDGHSLTIHRTLPELVKELERIEPGVTPRFYRFLEDTCHKYRLGRSEFVERDFEGARDFFGLRNLRLLLRTRALNNYYRSVSRFFRTEKLRQAFSLQTMYLGLSPFGAPAVYSLLPYTELAEDGLWVPEGGMYALIEAMETLATELGVRFHLNRSVAEVVVTKGRARGVRVNGDEIEADGVLVGADLPYAYRALLRGSAEGDFRLRKREKLEYTASAFMLYLGMDRKVDHMLHHNFYLSGRYKENFEAIFRDRRLPDDPSFYAVVPSRTDPNMAPEGMESLSVLVPVPHLKNTTWTGSATAWCLRRRSIVF
jgi:phytoene desaturase